jgi:hypothetical protein
MVERRRGPELQPHERREVDEKQDARRTQQPYATELDNRELEHAQKEKRPVASPPRKA